jgi:hypothetical protein
MAKSITKEKALTKDVLNRAVAKGIREASANAMKTAGSVLTVESGWVVRKYEDGKIEKIENLNRISYRDIERKISKLASNWNHKAPPRFCRPY